MHIRDKETRQVCLKAMEKTLQLYELFRTLCRECDAKLYGVLPHQSAALSLHCVDQSALLFRMMLEIRHYALKHLLEIQLSQELNTHVAQKISG